MHSLVILAAMCFAAMAHSHRYYSCEPCFGEECDVKPQRCRYGTYRDPCGRLQCMSGPGGRCGGRDNHLGKCGPGMSCFCGQCRGCSFHVLDNRPAAECYYNDSPVCY